MCDMSYEYYVKFFINQQVAYFAQSKNKVSAYIAINVEYMIRVSNLYYKIYFRAINEEISA